jgi:addiction module HigA family antidote
MTQHVVRMKNPSHPGELVKESLEDLGMSVADAAKALHITRQQLYNIVSCKSAISPEMAIRFEEAFGGSADMWLRMQAAYDLAQARMRRKGTTLPRFASSIK